MAKVTAPLLSFEGSGQIAKTQVYAKWKGVPYVRRHVIPANPNTTGQQTTRNTFSYLNSIWKFGSTVLQAPWTAYAKGKPLTNRNAFQKFNMLAIRGAANNDAFVSSPGANGGVIASSIATADAGGQSATITLGVPAVPSGWTITDSYAVLLEEGTDVTTDDPTTYEGSTGDDSGVVTVAAKAGTFVATGFFEMTHPDGTVAYGKSLGSTVTLA